MKVTATALQRLKEKLKRKPKGMAVRITVEDGHVQFRTDIEQKGDTVISDGGQSLLLVGAETADRISHRTLDAVETSDGRRLRFGPTVV